MKKKDVKVSLKDLYQMMISDTRYGYTRNNGLMPDGAFDHCRTYLPLMAREDADYAAHTAKQLAEEAISEVHRYSLGEPHNRFSIELKEGDRVQEIQDEWVKGLYRRSCGKEFRASPDMKVFVKGKESPILRLVKDKDSGKIMAFAVSEDNDYQVRLYKKDGRPGWWNSSINVYRDSGEACDEGEELFLEVSRKRKIGDLDLKIYMDFIEYCLQFLVDSTTVNKAYPYNYPDYLEFKIEHPIPDHTSD